MDERFERQRLLPEIGADGQRRIGSTDVVVSNTARVDVERAYLEAAGFRSVGLGDAVATPFVHASTFRHEAPRETGAAAWRALGVIRSTVVR